MILDLPLVRPPVTESGTRLKFRIGQNFGMTTTQTTDHRTASSYSPATVTLAARAVAMLPPRTVAAMLAALVVGTVESSGGMGDPSAVAAAAAYGADDGSGECSPTVAAIAAADVAAALTHLANGGWGLGPSTDEAHLALRLAVAIARGDSEGMADEATYLAP